MAATKSVTQKEKDKVIKESMFAGGKYSVKSAGRAITKSAVVIETLKTLLKEDLNIQGTSSHEDMIDICKAFEIDRSKWNAKEADAIKQVIEEHFHTTSLNGYMLTDLYKELFESNKLVYEFTDFMIADDLIPKGEEKVPKDLFYRKETLGTGEYDTDAQGNQVPHEKAFALECAYEIINFLTHVGGGGNLFTPNRSPDFSMGTLENDKIMVRVDIVNPLDLV